VWGCKNTGGTADMLKHGIGFRNDLAKLEEWVWKKVKTSVWTSAKYNIYTTNYSYPNSA